MTPPVVRILADAWTLARREREITLTLIGTFVWGPAFAVRLLTDPLPLPSEAGANAAWMDTVLAWGQANAGWHLLADLIALIGLATLAALYVSPGQPSVGEALRMACLRLPRLVLASIVASLAVGAGMWLLLIPGLYIQGRLIATVPHLVGQSRSSAIGALRASFDATRGAGFVLLGVTAGLFLAEWVATTPIETLSRWLREPEHLNPFVLALTEAVFAAIQSAWKAMLLLAGVVVYRRAASSGM